MEQLAGGREAQDLVPVQVAIGPMVGAGVQAGNFANGNAEQAQAPGRGAEREFAGETDRQDHWGERAWSSL
jgi:hypothetical protein